MKEEEIEQIRDIFNIPENAICTNCKKHKATQNWIGEGSTMDMIHGHYVVWCDCCALKAQIKYAEDAAKRLGELKKKLKKIKCHGNNN